jgi:hypothetical protein
MNIFVILSTTVILCVLHGPCHARQAECDKFAPRDSLVMDYFFNDEITRNKAYYKNGEITELLGYKKSKQIYFRKFFSDMVADSTIYYDDIGNVDYKVRFRYTPGRKELLGKRFNTYEDVRSRYMNSRFDVALKMVELYRYGVKSIELLFRNETMECLLVHDYSGLRKFTKKTAIDSVLRHTYIPNLEEDLTGRPPAEIQSYIKSHREMRDMVSRCMSRYRDMRGDIIVQFSIKRDGTVPEALILKSTVPCKNVAIELMNVIKNISFPDNSRYGAVTVTYPFQY